MWKYKAPLSLRSSMASFIHSIVHSLLYPTQGHRESWDYPKKHWAWDGNTPWMVNQIITRQGSLNTHTHEITPRSNLESSIPLLSFTSLLHRALQAKELRVYKQSAVLQQALPCCLVFIYLNTDLFFLFYFMSCLHPCPVTGCIHHVFRLRSSVFDVAFD